jgi:hypothetical protein
MPGIHHPVWRRTRHRKRSRESGQAVVLMAMMLVGLVALAGLAVDAGRLYAEKRRAQNAADNAALAASRAMCLGEDYNSMALLLAGQGGYDNDGVSNIVTVNSPPATGLYAGNPSHIEVTIVSNFPAMLIQIIRPGGLQITVRAVGRCRPGLGEGFAGVFAISQTCTNTILWSGSSGLVDGGLHSNRDVQIMGSGNTITGPASYVTMFDENDLTFIPPPDDNPTQISPMRDPLNLNLADYAPGGSVATEAAGAGFYRYRDGNITMNWLKANGYYDSATNIIEQGLYYATGNITINGANLIGAGVTFVAEGNVDFIGPNHNFSSYVDDLLVFSAVDPGGDGVSCNTPVIMQAHSGGVYGGYFYAPHGHINISGSDVVINGGLIGYVISLTGDSVTVDNPYDYSLPPPGTIEITD